MYQYFKGVIFQEHSNNMRNDFLRYYNILIILTKKWLVSKLSLLQQEYFKKYLFPIPSFDSRDFTFTKKAREDAQSTRKAETDAIVHLLPQIRAEGNFRWN